MSRELYRVGEAFSLHPVKVPELGGWEAREVGSVGRFAFSGK